MSGGARAGVRVFVAGEKRRLRVSLLAISEIEERTGMGFNALAKAMADEESLRIGHLLVILEEIAKAGGKPMTREDVESLGIGDVEDVSKAIRAAMMAAGVLDEEEDQGEADAGE